MPNLFRHSLLTLALWTACLLGGASADFSSFYEEEPEAPEANEANPLRGESRAEQPLDAAKLLDEAAGLERNGCYDGALAAYHELIARSPSGPLRTESLGRTARLHLSLGQLREAGPIYGELLAEDPAGPHAAEALAALARIDAAAGQTPNAKAQFRKVLEKFPQSPQASEAAYWLARTAADEKDTAQAERYVRRLLEAVDPQKYSTAGERKLWAQAVCLQCQLAAERGQWQLIQDVAADALPRLPQGADAVRVEFWWAEAEFRAGQFLAARSRFEQLEPRTVGIAEPWVPIVPWRRAQLAARNRQWNEVYLLTQRIEREFHEFPFPHELEHLRDRAEANRGDLARALGYTQR